MQIAIAEDSKFLRDALTFSLEGSDITVTANVETVDDLFMAIELNQPDAVILDICLPPTNTDEGIKATERFANEFPHIGVLVFSAYLSTPHVTRLLSAKPSGIGCMSKNQLLDASVLIDALRRVANGGTFIDPDYIEDRLRLDTFKKLLTERELEMLRLTAEGLSNQGIADRCHVTVKTVETNLTSIFRKLDLDSEGGNSRVQAVLRFLSRPQSFIKHQG